MGEDIQVSGGEDEAPAELEGMLSKPMLPVPGLTGSSSSARIRAAKQMDQGCHFQIRCSICLTVLVDKEWEANTGLVAESTRILPIPEPNGCEVGPGGPEILFVRAQLRDMLAAENSPEVP